MFYIYNAVYLRHIKWNHKFLIAPFSNFYLPAYSPCQVAFLSISIYFFNACIVTKACICKYIGGFGDWLSYITKPLLVIAVTSLEFFVS